ncbi:MAG: hypothetical protein COV48_05565, partial [Elusimicrobia bacterium CG11_big_fil_rev_8_21_14_0_20_64_6]
DGGSPESAARVAAGLLRDAASLSALGAAAAKAGQASSAAKAVAEIGALLFDRPGSFLLQ